MYANYCSAVHVWLFFGVKPNLIFLTTRLVPNIMLGSTIASDVILNPNILRVYLALIYIINQCY